MTQYENEHGDNLANMSNEELTALVAAQRKR